MITVVNVVDIFVAFLSEFDDAFICNSVFLSRDCSNDLIIEELNTNIMLKCNNSLQYSDYHFTSYKM